MAIGLVILICGSVLSGNVARHSYRNYVPHPLRTGATLAGISGVLGAMLDNLMGEWVAAGFITGGNLTNYIYIVLGFCIYVVVAMYIMLAVYYRRLIPVTVRAPNETRSRP